MQLNTSNHTLIQRVLLGQVGKVLGEKWKALSAKQREPYEAKAKADKERYESEKASYNVSGPAKQPQRYFLWLMK